MPEKNYTFPTFPSQNCHTPKTTFVKQYHKFVMKKWHQIWSLGSSSHYFMFLKTCYHISITKLCFSVRNVWGHFPNKMDLITLPSQNYVFVAEMYFDIFIAKRNLNIFITFLWQFNKNVLVIILWWKCNHTFQPQKHNFVTEMWQQVLKSAKLNSNFWYIFLKNLPVF